MTHSSQPQNQKLYYEYRLGETVNDVVTAPRPKRWCATGEASHFSGCCRRCAGLTQASVGRDGQPFRLQLDDALMLDVQRRIDVAVDALGAAVRTIPSANR